MFQSTVAPGLGLLKVGAGLTQGGKSSRLDEGEIMQPEERGWILRDLKGEEGRRMTGIGTSLVAQWLRIRLSMQRTGVRALVWEDPMCCGAT